MITVIPGAARAEGCCLHASTGFALQIRFALYSTSSALGSFFALTRPNSVREEVSKHCCLMLGRILKEFYARSPGYLKTLDCSKEVLNVLTGLGNQWIVMAQCFSLFKKF